MLEAIGNIGQALAALIAAVGIPLAVRQLGTQNRLSRLDVLRDLERRWSQRTDRAEALHPAGKPLLSSASTALVADVFAELGVQAAFTADQVDNSVPRLLFPLLPTLNTAPRNESEYEAALLTRCRTVFPVLDRLAASDAEDHRADLATLFAVVHAFTASLSDVAEMFDFGLADPDHFMEKRHLAVVREVHVIEPFLLWQSRISDHRSARALRTLALGASARTYSRLTDRYGTTAVVMRGAADNHLAPSPYGPILHTGTALRRLPRRLRWRLLHFAVARPFRDRTKQRQNRLTDRAIRLSLDPIGG